MANVDEVWEYVISGPHFSGKNRIPREMPSYSYFTLYLKMDKKIIKMFVF